MNLYLGLNGTKMQATLANVAAVSQQVRLLWADLGSLSPITDQ